MKIKKLSETIREWISYRLFDFGFMIFPNNTSIIRTSYVEMKYKTRIFDIEISDRKKRNKNI